MSIKTIVREIKRTLIGWERVDRIPNWAFKILWENRPIGFHYCIVNGKHYIYKLACEDNGGGTRA